MPMVLRSWVRLAPVIAAGAIALVTATAASAHAELLSTTPADGSVVATSPAQITLRFSEAVPSSLGSVRAFGPNAEQVATGAVNTPSPGDAGRANHRAPREGHVHGRVAGGLR